MLKPASFAIPWMISPIRRSCGLLTITISNAYPPARPASARSFLARATSRVEHLRLLSKYGLFGGSGPQPGVYWPSQATWFRASRSIESSRASRTRGSLASGVPRSPRGACFPVLLWMLTVMPS